MRPQAVSRTYIHLFEFTDQPWYPRLFRRMQTDYLQFLGCQGYAHQFLAPLLVKALQKAGTTQIVDLCSGGAGVLPVALSFLAPMI